MLCLVLFQFLLTAVKIHATANFLMNTQSKLLAISHLYFAPKPWILEKRVTTVPIHFCCEIQSFLKKAWLQHHSEEQRHFIGNLYKYRKIRQCHPPTYSWGYVGLPQIKGSGIFVALIIWIYGNWGGISCALITRILYIWCYDYTDLWDLR